MKFQQIDPDTGILLTPSYHGEECLSSGDYPGYECCCDECDYFLFCFPELEKNPSVELLPDFRRVDKYVIARRAVPDAAISWYHLSIQDTERKDAPGDCHVASLLAMTAVIGIWIHK